MTALQAGRELRNDCFSCQGFKFLIKSKTIIYKYFSGSLDS